MLFNKFAFKKSDLIENQQIVPLIEKLTSQKLSGSMHVIDLWNKQQQNNFLNIVEFNNSQYVLKDLARIQQNAKNQVYSKSKKPKTNKYNNFTNLDEQQIKRKVEASALRCTSTSADAEKSFNPQFNYLYNLMSKDFKPYLPNFDENIEMTEKNLLIAFLREHGIDFELALYEEIMSNSTLRKRIGNFFQKEHEKMRSECYAYHQYYIQQEQTKAKQSISGSLLRLF